MTVLHVSDFYPPRLGGIELHVRDLARHMHASGYATEILTETPQAIGQQDIVDRNTPGIVRLPDWKFSAGQRRAMHSAIEAADVVHCHVSLVSPMAWYAARRASRTGKPVVVTMHSMSESVPGAGFAFGVVLRGLGPVHWTSVSDVAARVLEPIVRRDVEVLPNAIDPSDWHPVLAEPSGPITLTAVMRLAPRKRAIPLMRILAEVRSLVPAAVPLRAVVAGDGPQRAQVARYAQARGVNFVEFPGPLKRPAISDLLSSSHVFLAPATLESFGIAALEARAAGLPVVAMKVGGVGEFVRSGREGLLVDDDTQMASAVARLILDHDLRQTIRRHNCLTPISHSWDHGVARAIALYRRLGANPSHVLASPPRDGWQPPVLR